MNSYKSKNPRKPSICKGCGATIKWVRGKGKKAVPVEPNGMYFLPDETGSAFIMSNGAISYGRHASDGILGYQKHVCATFNKRVPTEKELAQRCWA